MMHLGRRVLGLLGASVCELYADVTLAILSRGQIAVRNRSGHVVTATNRVTNMADTLMMMFSHMYLS